MHVQVARGDTAGAASGLAALEASFNGLRRTISCSSADAVPQHLPPLSLRDGAEAHADAGSQVMLKSDAATSNACSHLVHLAKNDQGSVQTTGEVGGVPDELAGLQGAKLVVGVGMEEAPQATEAGKRIFIDDEQYGGLAGENMEGGMKAPAGGTRDNVSGNVGKARVSVEVGAAAAARDAAVVERDALAAQLVETSAAAAAVTAESEAGRAAAEAKLDAAITELAEASAASAAVVSELEGRCCAAEASRDAAMAAREELAMQLAEASAAARAVTAEGKEVTLNVAAAEHDELTAQLVGAAMLEVEVSTVSCEEGGAATGTGGLAEPVEAAETSDFSTVLDTEEDVLRGQTVEASRTQVHEQAQVARGVVEEQSAVVNRLQGELQVAQAEAHRALKSMAASESEVKRKAAAALKKARALHETQTAELTGELEAERALRRADAAAAASALAAAESRVADAVATAAARGAAVEAARAAVEVAEAAAAAAVERQSAAEAAAAATQAVADAATAAAATATAEAAEREGRLKKALLDLKAKLKASTADLMRAEAAAAAAQGRVDELLGTAAAAEARAALLEREGERREAEARDYRNRAQTLLASKNAEIEAARADGGAHGAGVEQALALVGDLRAELAAQAANASAAAAACDAAEAAAAAAAAEATGLRRRVADAEAAAAAAKSRAAQLEHQALVQDAAARPAVAAVEAAPVDAELAASLAAVMRELAAFKQIAEQREAALESALAQLAELRAQRLVAPPTPPQLSPPAPVTSIQPPHWPTGTHLQSINTTAPAESPSRDDTPSPLHRDSSFDMDAMMATGTNAGAPTAAATAMKPLLHRIAELEAEVVELTADVGRYEAQAQVLKEELREVERSKSREATGGNAQVWLRICASV
jgi:trimeric autotransporter adhesin